MDRGGVYAPYFQHLSKEIADSVGCACWCRCRSSYDGAVCSGLKFEVPGRQMLIGSAAGCNMGAE